MALDWKREIDLKSLFSRKKGGLSGSITYPSKTTINLYRSDQQATDKRKVILACVLGAIVLGLFVKFGVLDQMAVVSQMENELNEQRALSEKAKANLGDYADVQEAYEAYLARYGKGATDAIAVLDMVEKNVMSKTTVTSIVLGEDILTLTLYNVSLDTVGNLAKDLESQEMVSKVNVSTATTQNAEGLNTVSTLVINLVSNESEEQ